MCDTDSPGTPISAIPIAQLNALRECRPRTDMLLGLAEDPIPDEPPFNSAIIVRAPWISGAAAETDARTWTRVHAQRARRLARQGVSLERVCAKLGLTDAPEAGAGRAPDRE